jgi:Resolvase, N terminal domain
MQLCEIVLSIALVAEYARSRRDELRTVLEFLRKGDVLMVTRIDRLARSIPVFLVPRHGGRAGGLPMRASAAQGRTLPRRKPRLLRGCEVSHASGWHYFRAELLQVEHRTSSLAAGAALCTTTNPGESPSMRTWPSAPSSETIAVPIRPQ